MADKIQFMSLDELAIDLKTTKKRLAKEIKPIMFMLLRDGEKRKRTYTPADVIKVKTYLSTL